MTDKRGWYVSDHGRILKEKNGKDYFVHDPESYPVSVAGTTYMLVYKHGGEHGLTQGVRVHRLVAKYFLPCFRDDPDCHVKHIDGDLLNNRTDNLRIDDKGSSSLPPPKPAAPLSKDTRCHPVPTGATLCVSRPDEKWALIPGTPNRYTSDQGRTMVLAQNKAWIVEAEAEEEEAMPDSEMCELM